ncbi:transcription factor VOZ1-like isoform X1 [Cucurbita maxima]|uniref:Transcription factor VOZ1-like isoform X1 n=1 Tax=Cucurbita maxima TaxID=3661 RepID=A0A6J1I4J6_CUCMA|nr:transcription factor VOZ1-like isoform X1 [Cucurbita maxima]XP_022971015.1 transcription factor VOZ1-like isoform X1 [Cucurbita maxima]XP_022971016.1 transcription factor VOZ1-like isoform X1 [Cucurbita maxima]
MPRGLKSNCQSTSHQLLKEKAKNRVNDLQGIFTNLQSARKESRTTDVAVLEEQVHQMLREWNAELNEPSPASSFVEGSLGSFSQELARLLEHFDEEDDATSTLAEPKVEPDQHCVLACNPSDFQQQHSVLGFEECKVNSEDFKLDQNFVQNLVVGMDDMSTMDCRLLDSHQEFDYGVLIGAYDAGDFSQDTKPSIPPYISPPPSAFMGPMCALWDCFRPVQGSKWCQDYCSSCHSMLAINEGLPGMAPILRPGGTGLTDGPLFAALLAKTQAKEVGIPICDGAATRKSPWNAPELFDISFLEGETIREWLYFDKPRRAFESGTRKQRSLPDYSGRGWHESRKKVMEEFGGQKKSYYMDPQPSSSLEWHLYEYDISNYDSFALYRLELKQAGAKKSPKGKLPADPLADLQKKMGRLTAKGPVELGQSVK